MGATAFLLVADILHVLQLLQCEHALSLFVGQSPTSQHPPLLFFLKNVARIASAMSAITMMRIIQLAAFINMYLLGMT